MFNQRFWLSFLYKTFWGRLFRFLFRTHFAACLYAWFQDSSLSCYKIKRFVRQHDIKMSDFVILAGGYRSFNDFFTRCLRSNAREVDRSPDSFISPADGKLLVVPKLAKETSFFIKNNLFDLKTFLGDDELAQEYEGATMFLFRLAPDDYHRFHFPCDATFISKRIVHGRLESVNPIVYKSGIQPLHENERQIAFLKTKSFDNIIIGAVGAMFVGAISWTAVPGCSYRKGDELGHFSFGGSSLVVLVKKGVLQPESVFVVASEKNEESVVRMGERVGQTALRSKV
ncbi:phosphatidylserine decarboxylase [Candidatus Babeliales bacterium]|nr:phosphatidylserine decarboxylase [Candidatus Babeliales bacterium]